MSIGFSFPSGKIFLKNGCIEHYKSKYYELVEYLAYEWCYMYKIVKKYENIQIRFWILLSWNIHAAESETCGKRIRKVMNSLVAVTESSNGALVKRREERRVKSFNRDTVSRRRWRRFVAVKIGVVTKAA